MKFHPTPLEGAYTIELEKRGDDRGFFARFFCQREFSGAGIPMSIVQINNSLSAKTGTLRGMHYQLPPAAEIKVVRCIRGALYDAIIDLRPDSPTFGRWFGVELTAENRLMIVVPQGFAHGILTLTDDTEAFYLVNAFYGPEQERGIRFDDPRFGIDWPRAPDEISAKDQSWPDFDPAFHGVESLRGLRWRILLTGASSFTGLWFARSLAKRGHEVVAPLKGSTYTGLREKRVEELRRIGEVVEDCPFGSSRFLELAAHGSWDVLCHHAARTGNYRDPDFDVLGAVSENTYKLPDVLKTMQGRGLKGVVVTGSVFEQDEGAGEAPLRAFSPYGLSKGLTWQYCRFLSERTGFRLGKFVIANPFGPFEEPRFCNYLIETWSCGEIPTVRTPLYVRDNIHIDLLGLLYASYVEKVVAQTSLSKLNPSFYVESQGAFAHRFAAEMSGRLSLECPLVLHQQEDFSEPMVRINTDRTDGAALGWIEHKAWDAEAEYYLQILGR